MRLPGTMAGAVLAATATACAVPAPYPMAPRAPAPPGTPATRLLAAHNAERAPVGAPILSWDPALAASAAGHARILAASGRLQHSPRSARPGQGENLWIGTRGAFSLEQMVGSWASERRWFVPGVFPAVSRTGRWSDVGHYTQMIWPTTGRLGCALGSSARYDVLVCRYSPAGNIDGRRLP